MPIRFTPIKFPLKMRGVDIRNLDDLRKNFDLNAAVEYFRNGKLIQWLKARYHNDEAEKVAALNENTPDFRENLCAALGVAYDKKILRNNGGIVYEMFQWDENGNIIFPSNDTVTAANEREYQPISQSSPRSEFADIFETIFGKRGVWEVVKRNGMIVVGTKSPEMLEAEQSLKDLYGDDYREWGQKLLNVDFDVDVEKKILTPTQKKMFLKMVCEGKYTEDDLIFIRVVDDFSSGFAFTKDSFCIGGELFDYQGSSKFRTAFYKEIIDIEFGGYSSDWAEKKVPTLRIKFKNETSSYYGAYNSDNIFFNVDNVQSKYTTAIITENILWQIGKFLEFVKD